MDGGQKGTSFVPTCCTLPSLCRSYYHKGTSLTGGGVLVSQRTGRILAVGTRHKFCRTCASAATRGVQPPPHKCQKNWSRSSKAMEADLGKDLVGGLRTTGLKPIGVVMDCDASTESALREIEPEADVTMKDKNHIFKLFGADLLELKAELAKSSKGEKSNDSVLSQNVIDKLIGDSKYCVMQKHEATDADFKLALRNVIAHNFDEHDGCSADWCHALQPDGEAHKPRLPRGQYLRGNILKSGLLEIVDKWCDAKHLVRLRNSGSSQGNESFHVSQRNHHFFTHCTQAQVAVKAPKAKFFGGLSYDTRVGLAVLQKQDGKSSVGSVLEEMGITQSQLEHDKHGLWAAAEGATREHRKTREYKAQRRKNKLKRKSQGKQQEAQDEKDGLQYAPGMALGRKQKPAKRKPSAKKRKKPDTDVDTEESEPSRNTAPAAKRQKKGKKKRAETESDSATDEPAPAKPATPRDMWYCHCKRGFDKANTRAIAQHQKRCNGNAMDIGNDADSDDWEGDD